MEQGSKKAGQRSQKHLRSRALGCLLWVAGGLSLAGLAGCSSTPKVIDGGMSQAVPTRVELKRGQTRDNPSPLPNAIPITQRQFYSDGFAKDGPGYVEYDFNRDGLADMLEVYDGNPTPVGYAYDFDFDGKIDAYERVTPRQKKSHMPK